MNSLEEGFIRRSLKPRVDCDIPGRLRLSFARYAMLPEAAKPYLHYVEDVLKLLPGVLEVRLNPRIGTILVLYTPGEVERGRSCAGWASWWIPAWRSRGSWTVRNPWQKAPWQSAFVGSWCFDCPGQRKNRGHENVET